MYKDIPKHIPVLVSEVLEHLNVRKHSTYLDVTFGSGGHTREILMREPTCRVIAMDWDKKALETFGIPLQEEFGSRLRLVWGNFGLLYKIAKKEGIAGIDGILADFGTSQVQLRAKAGFSFNYDSPLDMRMSAAHHKLTAAEVIRTFSCEQLQNIIFKFGEEKKSKKIARAIVSERQKRDIRTTKDLARLVSLVVPKTKPGIHPATKTFQALRIFVNKELEHILAFLSSAVSLLRKEGRLVCISFHSLEERIVKHFLLDEERRKRVRLITKRVVKPANEEIRRNPSARSARLRAAERL
jgi:16S rRNA (cytosine1402-N4)-methyltransferase